VPVSQWVLSAVPQPTVPLSGRLQSQLTASAIQSHTNVFVFPRRSVCALAHRRISWWVICAASGSAAERI